MWRKKIQSLLILLVILVTIFSSLVVMFTPKVYAYNPSGNARAKCSTLFGASASNSLACEYGYDNANASVSQVCNQTNLKKQIGNDLTGAPGSISYGALQTSCQEGWNVANNKSVSSGVPKTVKNKVAPPGQCIDTSTPVNGVCANGCKVTNQTACANSTSSGNSTNYVTACESSGGAFSWFICAALSTLGSVEDFIISNVVQPLLKTNPVEFNAPTYCDNQNNPQYQSCSQSDRISATIYKVWSNFRIYGDLLLVIAILIAIIIEAAGGGNIAEAYTVKRILPRILAAAILINLSIYLVAATEDVINVLGNGVENLLLLPFQGVNGAANIHVSGSTGVLTTLGLTGIAVVGGITEGIAGFALFILSGFIIAAIGVLITLVFRQALLVVLLMTSPLAFALYVLPNTEQYFRKWWDLLIKTLIVYPIVMAAIAASSIAALIMSNFGIKPAIISQLIGIMAAAAPLFVVPFAFRMSGGVIGQVSNGINSLANKAREPLRNLRHANRQARLQRAREGNLFRGESRLARTSSNLVQGAMFLPRAGLNPRQMRNRLQAARSAHTSASASRAAENADVAAVIKNDDLLNASLYGDMSEDSARAYLGGVLGQSGRELEQNVASITQARRAVGREAFNDAAVVANAGTGTGYGRRGPSEMLAAINRVAGNDRARAARLLAGARTEAERARRIDLYGSGFAQTADMLTTMYEGRVNAATVDRVLTDNALLTKSAAEVGSSRNNGLGIMAPAIERRLDQTEAAVRDAYANPAVPDAEGRTGVAKTMAAERQYKQALAMQANMLDAASQYSPENGQLLADRIMARATTVYVGGTPTTITVGQAIEGFRGDTEFTQIRREFNTPWAAGAAGAGVPPPGTPPGGGPPAPVSDIRLKTHIKYLKTLDNGINIYEFQYIWGGPSYIGVMAQEIIKTHPNAVIIGSDGYYRVNYESLGLKFLSTEDAENEREYLNPRITN
ncbi:MAG: tail fiber domain-containing protein [Candidatus Saccharimonadales bacterium]